MKRILLIFLMTVVGYGWCGWCGGYDGCGCYDCCGGCDCWGSLTPVTSVTPVTIETIETSVTVETVVSNPPRLLVTEVLFDPEPAVGLGEEEYVEIFNPGVDTVDLRGWRVVVGTERVVVVVIVVVGVIGKEGKEGKEQGVSKIGPGEYGLLKGKGLPTLRNTGDRVTLVDGEGREVHSVEYATEMHKDALKAHGGWSLELADMVHWNSRKAWVSSEDPSGGTPGRANSVNIHLPDEDPPVMLRAGWYDESLMFVLFSGTVSQTGDCKANFEPGGLVLTPAPAPVYGFPGFFFRVPPDLRDTIIYRVELQGTITSCYGEPALLKPVGFAVAHHPDSSSVVINEIMFDPATGDPEWIELLNRSKYTVDLKDLIIARADTSGIIHTFSFPHQNFLLPPSSFLLFPDSLALLSSETRPTFPSLTNEPSRLLLLDPSQHIIDQAAYSPDWHDPYLTDSKGISLERIDPSAPGLLRSNWYSCNESQKSTPCKSNSNYSPNPHPPSLTIHYSLLTIHCLSSEPMIIHYEFPSPGWYHELKIFDRSGALIRTAVPFSLAGSSGVLMWDGLDDRKQRVPEGIYVLIIRYRHPGGQWGRWKGVCGLTLD